MGVWASRICLIINCRKSEHTLLNTRHDEEDDPDETMMIRLWVVIGDVIGMDALMIISMIMMLLMFQIMRLMCLGMRWI